MADRRIIRGATVVALDGRRVLRKTDVLIKDGIIAAIGGVEPEGALITDARGVLMPGLTQAHVHLDQVLLDRHFVPDVDPRVYARAQIPWWLSELDNQGLTSQAEAGFARGLRTGTVAFGDAGRGNGRLLAIDAARRLGVRLIAGIDASRTPNLDRDFGILSAEIESLGASSLIGLAVWAGDAERTSMRCLKSAAKLASKKEIPLVVHLGMFPGDPTGLLRLERAGAVGRRLVLCHGTGHSLRDPKSIEMLAQARASLVLTPAFDLFMGAPSPPLESLIGAKVNLALGSETGATRIGFDLFKELRLLYRWLVGRVPQPASTALEIVTRGGAHAFGINSGSVTVGQSADLMLIDVEAEPSEDYELVARRIIVQGEAAIIRTVWVGGQVSFSDGRFTRSEPPSETEEESLRARVGFAAEQWRKVPLTFAKFLGELLGRRHRLAHGWHQGRLPFLGDGDGAPPSAIGE